MNYVKNKTHDFSVRTMSRTHILINVHCWLIKDQRGHQQIELIRIRSYAHRLMVIHRELLDHVSYWNMKAQSVCTWKEATVEVSVIGLLRLH